MGLIFSVFLFVCGIGAAGALIKEESYGVAVLFFGVFAGIAKLVHWGATRSSAKHNPAVRVLLEQPESVTEVGHSVGSSSGGGMRLHWLYAVTPHGRVAMQVPAAKLKRVGRALAQHCPNATIDVPGVER